MLANEKLRPKANGRNVRTPADCSPEPNGRFDGPRGVVGRLGDRQSSAGHTFKDGHSSQFCRAGFCALRTLVLDAANGSSLPDALTECANDPVPVAKPLSKQVASFHLPKKQT